MAKAMTRSQINKFAVGFPYPTDVVEVILRECEFDKKKAIEILTSGDSVVFKTFQNSKHVGFI